MIARPLVYLLGAAAVLGALIAAGMPLALSAVDRAGAPIPCGNGFRPAYGVAAQQDLLNLDQHTLGGPGYAESDYTAQCAGLVGARRAAALSVGGSGVALTLVAFATPHLVRALASRRRRQAEHPRPAEPVGDQPDHAGVGAQRFADDIGTGVTQPILEKSVGEQVGRHSYVTRTRGAGSDAVTAAAVALGGDGFGDSGRAGRGIGEFYAVAGNG